ncbi:ubiquitin carboxyl-terminal hydrolase 14 [Aureobasidium pullulans]|nr:ubiquitin carboxyl-terminal hydrolase 14 [Aureobasidium pullulans]
MSACPHVSSASLSPPRPSQSVYREDCTLCFDSIDSPEGLDVCLHCFNGGCATERQHGAKHAQEANHPLALNIKRTRKQKHRDEPPQKMSKLAINAETEEDRFDTVSSVKCFECANNDIEKSHGNLQAVVDGVLKANTFAKQEEVKAWEQEMIPCEHTLCLEQETSRHIESQSLGHCSQCDLNENLWLCLTCGNLGCGRSQFGGVGGNSHGVAHTDSTKHPVAVKLGSLTADGSADIYCYACNEERTDPELVAHLAHWGIDIAGRQKTEKSLTEMQLEQNLRWEFSMTNEDGKELKPMCGPGLTGLKNLGNSCYLASVVQSLFAMPEFAQRYYRPDEKLPKTSDPAEDIEIQLRKMADGLLSGRYANPNPDVVASEDTTEQPHQKGIAPAMLKHLIGRGHSEFSTMRQQDAFEFLLHLLKLVSRSQRAAKDNYKDVSDPVDAFRFVMEQKLQCLNCNKVRYRQDEAENISVAVPIKRLQKDTKMEGVTPGPDGSVEKDTEEFESVTLQRCLDEFTAAEVVELNCGACGGKNFTKQSLFKTFPSILAVNARRFEIVNWVPTKQDVPVIVDEGTIDFEAYRSKGQQPGEELLPDDAADAGAGSTAFVPNEAALSMLEAMGFPRVRCEKALHATGNTDAETASLWLFEHMEDPDIDEPVDLSGGGAGASASNAVDPEKIEMLGNMGFGAPQARQALKETSGDVERAVEWLFNHPDATGDFGEEQESGDQASAQQSESQAVLEDNKPANFKLQSIVCHKGGSIHAGHYVAFIRKEPGWILFNDEKVALGGDVEEMKKFAYIYFFRREAA